MRKLKKAAVIGVYGSGADFTTGQAVKCHSVIDWMKGQYGASEVVVVNTYQWKKNVPNLLRDLVSAMRGCRNIVIMPAQHGVKVFAPLVCALNKAYRRSVHYIVIGGWLAEMLQGKPFLKKSVSSFDGVYVELRSMKAKLEAAGLRNVYFMPNSRALSEPCARPSFDNREPVRICTYSRVVKTKGIEDAIAICRCANRILGRDVFRLDIYGRISGEYKQEFEQLMRAHSDTAVYRGCKDAEETLATLENYFALVFPTYYEGEGFAGTILDAFAAELPIVANDWKYNGEIIEDGVNGFLYPFRDVEVAAQKLAILYREPELYRKIRCGCRESAKRYSTEYVMKEFADMLQP